MNKGHLAKETVVVGHWPTQNYRNTEFNGKVYVNKEKRIIAIDGGYGVKQVGQINALIIEKQNGNVVYSSTFEDDFEEYSVIQDCEYDEPAVLLNWNDSAFKLIEQRDEFSLCQKTRTGEQFLMRNEFIDYRDKETVAKYNYISQFHSVNEGDVVRVIETYGDYCYIKYHGKVGWVEKAALNFAEKEIEVMEVEEEITC